MSIFIIIAGAVVALLLVLSWASLIVKYRK